MAFDQSIDCHVRLDDRSAQLIAPVSVLDDFSNAVDILTSEGLIIKSRGQINFFHESFFDYVYARAFVNRDQ